MSPKELYLKHKQLGKINTQVQQSILKEKFGISNYNLTFGEMNFNDLDNIEFIMELEKRLDIIIPDDVVEHLTNPSQRPIDFMKFLRDEKLNLLGI
jgi:acyl carrier protein